MFDVLGMAASLKRPTMLVQTARFGVDGYRRDFHLPRILKCANVPRAGEALIKLLDIEADFEELRISDRAEYTAAAHIDILIAIMGEADFLRTCKNTPRL